MMLVGHTHAYRLTGAEAYAQQQEWLRQLWSSQPTPEQRAAIRAAQDRERSPNQEI